MPLGAVSLTVILPDTILKHHGSDKVAVMLVVFAGKFFFFNAACRHASLKSNFECFIFY
jgi:hypothetical protein